MADHSLVFGGSFFFPECRLGEENEDFFIVLEPVQVSLGIKKNKIKNTNHVWA